MLEYCREVNFDDESNKHALNQLTKFLFKNDYPPVRLLLQTPWWARLTLGAFARYRSLLLYDRVMDYVRRFDNYTTENSKCAFRELMGYEAVTLPIEKQLGENANRFDLIINRKTWNWGAQSNPAPGTVEQLNLTALVRYQDPKFIIRRGSAQIIEYDISAFASEVKSQLFGISKNIAEQSKSAKTLTEQMTQYEKQLNDKGNARDKEVERISRELFELRSQIPFDIDKRIGDWRREVDDMLKRLPPPISTPQQSPAPARYSAQPFDSARPETEADPLTQMRRKPPTNYQEWCDWLKTAWNKYVRKPQPDVLLRRSLPEYTVEEELRRVLEELSAAVRAEVVSDLVPLKNWIDGKKNWRAQLTEPEDESLADWVAFGKQLCKLTTHQPQPFPDQISTLVDQRQWSTACDRLSEFRAPDTAPDEVKEAFIRCKEGLEKRIRDAQELSLLTSAQTSNNIEDWFKWYSVYRQIVSARHNIDLPELPKEDASGQRSPAVLARLSSELIAAYKAHAGSKLSDQTLGTFARALRQEALQNEPAGIASTKVRSVLEQARNDERLADSAQKALAELDDWDDTWGQSDDPSKIPFLSNLAQHLCTIFDLIGEHHIDLSRDAIEHFLRMMKVERDMRLEEPMPYSSVPNDLRRKFKTEGLPKDFDPESATLTKIVWNRWLHCDGQTDELQSPLYELS